MSSEAVVSVFAVGAALLGFWVATRFPDLGPRSLRGTLLTLFAAFLWLNASVPLFAAAVRSLEGPLAFLGVLLPTLAFFFWACACAMRLAAAHLGRVR